jgi:Na+/glutamate symporter
LAWVFVSAKIRFFFEKTTFLQFQKNRFFFFENQSVTDLHFTKEICIFAEYILQDVLQQQYSQKIPLFIATFFVGIVGAGFNTFCGTERIDRRKNNPIKNSWNAGFARQFCNL